MGLIKQILSGLIKKLQQRENENLQNNNNSNNNNKTANVNTVVCSFENTFVLLCNEYAH